MINFTGVLTAVLLFGLVLHFSQTLALAEEVPPAVRFIAEDATSGDTFGRSVAVEGNLAVVGAPYAEHDGIDCGAVYLRQYNGVEWNSGAKLVVSDCETESRFGWSVALSENRVVVGAPFDSELGYRVGAMYVLELVGATWEETKLQPLDAADNQQFGKSVAIDGDRIVVGAPKDIQNGANSGAAYVFVLQDGNWVEQQKLTREGAAPSEFFGSAVSMHEQTIAVSGYGIDSHAGAVVVFIENGSGWSEQATLIAADRVPNDHLGSSVDIFEDRIVSGAKDAFIPGANEGAAYVFRRNKQDEWSQEAKLSGWAPEGGNLGWSVAIGAQTIVLGDPEYNPGFLQNSGAVYVYRLNEAWNEHSFIPHPAQSPQDRFGSSLSLSNARLLVGVPEDDYEGNDAGAAYVFELEPGVVPNCPADVTADGIVDFADILAVLVAWGPCADCPEDADGNGVVDFADILAIVLAWGPCA